MTRDFAKSTESFLNAFFKDTKRKASASVQQHRTSNGIIHYVTVAAENGVLCILSTPNEVASFLAGKSAPTPTSTAGTTTTGTTSHSAGTTSTAPKSGGR